MKIFVAGFNGFHQWTLRDNVIKNFHEVSLESVFGKSDPIKQLCVTIDWSYNAFILDGDILLTGFITDELNKSFKLLSHPDGRKFASLCGNNKHILAFSKTSNVLWKYDLFQPDEKISWQQITNFMDIENAMDDDSDKILDNIVKVVCSIAMNICLTSEGRLFNVPTEIPTSHIEGKVIDVQCGNEHAVLLTDTGKVYTWGGGSRCQLGHGTTENADDPTLVEALDGIGILKIAAGGWHTCAISIYGDLYMWGWNDKGQLGIYRSENMTNKPTAEIQNEKILYESVFENNDFFDPIAFQSTSLNLKQTKSQEDQKKVKGKNDKNEESYNSYASPCLIDIYDFSCDKILEHNVISVACGSKHTVIVLDNGCVLGSGCNQYGQLGIDPLARDNLSYFSPLSLKVNPATTLQCGAWSTALISLV